MKKLVKNLSLFALVFAIGSAFAFNVPEDSGTSWFAVEPSGLIDVSGTISQPNCTHQDMTYCAVEFDDNDLDGNGEPPISNVEDPSADQIYLDLTYKP